MNIAERTIIRTGEQVAVFYPEHGLNCRYLRSITDEPQDGNVNRNFGLEIQQNAKKSWF